MPPFVPRDSVDITNVSWADLEPHYRELEMRPLEAGTVDPFLTDWTALAEVVGEAGTRLRIASTQNTADEEVERRYRAFLDEIEPQTQRAEQRLKEKLLASGLQPKGMEEPTRRMRAEAELFRDENVPLLSEEQKLTQEYFKITGAQTVQWEGKEIPRAQLQPMLQETDRAVRERAWRLGTERRLADREAIDDLWLRLLRLRLEIAQNAGMPDYRAYRWQQFHRFDYTPDDARRFHAAIEEVVVPVLRRILERRREQLGVETVRPWDLSVDPLGRPPLRPFTDVAELEARCADMFHRVDRKLGRYFATMIQEDLLDLESRKNKAPGGYCTELPAAKKPFIFMNAVGTQDDVLTLLHEAGHAFHAFERSGLPYHQQRLSGMEFREVASMAMELLAAPYFAELDGGFYSPADAARARLEHLEGVLWTWSYVMTVDAFQHWIYENPADAHDTSQLEAQWAELRERFLPGIDWSELEDALLTGWQDVLHIHVFPFYMIEYAMAQLGAVQVWANALKDQGGAVKRYRRALALGGTIPLPELYAAVGARFAFDADTVREAVSLIEGTMEELESGEGMKETNPTSTTR